MQFRGLDSRHLQEEDSGADDEEGEDDGDDLGSTGFEALVQDNGSDEGAEGEELEKV